MFIISYPAPPVKKISSSIAPAVAFFFAVLYNYVTSKLKRKRFSPKIVCAKTKLISKEN